MKNELESNEETRQASVKNSAADIRALTPEDKHAVWVTDGDERFVVPKRYVHAILKAVPMLRHSFEHLGGRHVGHVSQFSETVRHAEHPAEPKESVEKEYEVKKD